MATERLTVVRIPGNGAEDVLIGPKGHVWTATEDGSVFRLTPDGHLVERVATTGGRPLGLELLGDGRILVCDGDRGLLAVDPGSGSVEVLTSHVDGQPLRFCNNAAVHSDGRIFFTDTSSVYSVHQWKNDLIEATRSGRLLVRHTDGSVDVVLSGLEFANGVALSADESYVAVAGTRGATTTSPKTCRAIPTTCHAAVTGSSGWPSRRLATRWLSGSRPGRCRCGAGRPNCRCGPSPNPSAPPG
jgi:sugar lactone lactonase YvrE